jgi:hypothetical protein
MHSYTVIYVSDLNTLLIYSQDQLASIAIDNNTLFPLPDYKTNSPSHDFNTTFSSFFLYLPGDMSDNSDIDQSVTSAFSTTKEVPPSLLE